MKETISKFKKGTQYVNIVAPVSTDQLTQVNEVKEGYLDNVCIKFIPASGAATRMFKDLYEFLEDGISTAFISAFFSSLEDFAFYEEIRDEIEAKSINRHSKEGMAAIIRMILADRLNYGDLPKALLKVHTYGGKGLTPIDEHIYEGQHYLKPGDGRLHFTISKDHEDLFKRYVKGTGQGEATDISYSFQKKQTDTMAVDMDNQPFLMEDGEILYRAGGHGALIENLNDLDGDIIFIKNIDNVCHRDHVAETIEAKKLLATAGYEAKEQIDAYIRQIIEGDFDLDEIAAFIKETLNIHSKEALTKETALGFLNRPLKVCGMVKNQGEPGGGPFIVDNGGYTDLQICEKSEIDLTDEGKRAILEASEYFNPVDLVCFVRDYKGDKFNLLDFINEDRYFISEKSYKGRKLKALEHPGLWNGAMHHWNTLFVEVPLTTFNPIKNVNDLLRKGHRSAAK